MIILTLTDPQPQEPMLWYGIGILYDRYGSLDHAEEAFSLVMQMQPDFEKANEIYFRLGILYKKQKKTKKNKKKTTKNNKSTSKKTKKETKHEPAALSRHRS